MKPASISWPAAFLPTCQTTGVFPLGVLDSNRTYIQKSIALHLHDYPGDLFIGRHRYRLEPGDITFSPPRLPSRYSLQENGTHLCIHFLPAGAAVRSPRIRLPLHLRLGAPTAGARERFWRVIDYARQSSGIANSIAGHAASAALQELLLWLALRSGERAAPGPGSLIEPALKKLRENIDRMIARPSSIADLATNAGLSSAYLARAFRHRFGMNIQHYVLQRRIELARHLLTSSNLKVAEIGRRVGLPDPQYFNKQFRRIAGISPLAYRRGTARKTRETRRKVSPA